MNDIMSEWGYRRKFRPEHLDEYDDDDKAWHYNHTEFYEIEDVDDQTVIVHFFNGNKETGTRTTSRRDLNYCERLWGIACITEHRTKDLQPNGHTEGMSKA